MQYLTRDASKEKTFVDKIRNIYLHVQETLKKSREKYKARYDQHRTKRTFIMGDKVWL
jgi:hypothetical protein